MARGKWTELASFQDSRLTFFAVNPQNGSVMYAGLSPNRAEGRDQLVKSIDGGITWSSASMGLPTVLGLNGLTIDPQNPDILYARMGREFAAVDVSLFKSMDGGANWRPIGSGTLPRSSIKVLAVDPQSPNILYAQSSSFTAALYKSTDGGETWSSIQTPGVAWNFTVDPQNSGTVYVGGPSGGFKTTDGGITWSPIPLSRINAFLIDPQNTITVYAGTSHGLYRSRDGGATWNEVIAGLPMALNISSLAIDLKNSSKIYAATMGGGVFATFTSPALTLDRAVYCVGDSWILKVSKAAPTATIRLIGTSNGHAWELIQWQMTDVNGGYQEGGTLSQDTAAARHFVSRSMG